MHGTAAPVAVAAHASPWGPIHLAASAAGIVGLEVRTTDDAFGAALVRRLRVPLVAARAAPSEVRVLLDEARRQLDGYVAGERRAFDLPLVPLGISAWDRRVLDGVRVIGFGEVTSYGRLARMVGAPGAARAAGGAVGRNPIGLLIPCHRVINGDGSLGGYGGSWFGSREELLELKRALLAHEGVAVRLGAPAASGRPRR